MENKNQNLTPQTGTISGDPARSRVDLFSGKHTASLIVGALFVIVFIGFIIYVVSKDEQDNSIVNGFFSLLSLLAGFFAGYQINIGNHSNNK